MIFQELVLQNFGPYRDRQVLDLATDEDSPIILFGGFNGGGKTTLLDSIRLALYGQRAQCSTRGTLSYSDFLNQSRNRRARKQLTILELSFQQTLNTREPSDFRIRRTWTHLNKNGRDTLEVFLNGEPSEDLTKGWDERIEGILPLGISNLFLFDGEQVKDLAEDLTLPPAVVNAIRNLLGLELPERLSTDLDVLINRKRKAAASQTDLNQLEDIEKTLNQQELDRKNSHQTCASVRPRLERAREELKNAEEQFISEGGKVAAEKAQTELLIAQTQSEQDNHLQQLRECASGALPLMMVRSLLGEAQQQARDEVQHQQFEVAKDLIQSQQQELLSFVETKEFSKQQIKQMQTFFKQQGKELTQSQGSIYLGINSQEYHRLSHILEHQLPNQLRTAKTTLKKLEQIHSKLDSLERYAVTAAAPEIYQKLSQQVSDKQKEVSKLQADFEQANRRYEQTKQAIERTKKELASYSHLVIDIKNTDHLLQSASKVQQTLDVYKQRLKLHKLNHLETLTTECFLYLLHKSNFVHRVQIDTETFALQLYDREGESVPKHRLSAGEKQLLAIALLWGLARASGRHLPIAIDTPLGRLDSKHRKNLVERYFPQASHQVLLLSTDTEIRDKEVKLLRKQNAIAREYLLKHDAKKRTTDVHLGYFW